jgi:hypothetical protein
LAGFELGSPFLRSENKNILLNQSNFFNYVFFRQQKVWIGIRGRPEHSDTWRQRRARRGRVVTMPWRRLPRGGWMGRVEYTPTRPDTMLPLAYNKYMVTTRVADPDPNWIRIQSGPDFDRIRVQEGKIDTQK